MEPVRPAFWRRVRWGNVAWLGLLLGVVGVAVLRPAGGARGVAVPDGAAVAVEGGGSSVADAERPAVVPAAKARRAGVARRAPGASGRAPVVRRASGGRRGRAARRASGASGRARPERRASAGRRGRVVRRAPVASGRAPVARRAPVVRRWPVVRPV